METIVININLANLCQNEEKQDTKEKLSSPAVVSGSRPNNGRLHMSRAKTYAAYFRALNIDKYDQFKVDELTRICAQQYRDDKRDGYL